MKIIFKGPVSNYFLFGKDNRFDNLQQFNSAKIANDISEKTACCALVP